jgi:hypothetical protein
MEIVGSFAAIGLLVIAFISFGLFILNIVTSIWAYRDALQKGKGKEFALIVLIGTIIFPVIGLIVYLIIRND